ncbi:hypothetical protein [uncultured Akkermansia sp.]|uniref:hypothetical protein n=1 Tax=uncultured Akkermansia sp. TaxID=512294 RepID=UPI0025D85D79|nr:hypothetical protein [uncultured Akkermansia sp.]
MAGFIVLSCTLNVQAVEKIKGVFSNFPDMEIEVKPSKFLDPIELNNKETKSLEDIEKAAEAYARKHYPDYKVIHHLQRKDWERNMAFIWTVVVENNEEKVFIDLDVTKCIQKIKAKGSKIARGEVEEFEKRLDKKLRYTTIIRGDSTVIHPGK